MYKFFKPVVSGRAILYAFLFSFVFFSNNVGFACSDFSEEVGCSFAGEVSGSNEFVFQLNIKTLKEKLSFAVSEKNIRGESSKTIINFPLPSGKTKAFAVADSPIMEASGEKMYDYKSYLTHDPKTGEISGRFSVSKNGMNGVFDDEGKLFSIQSIDNESHKSVFNDQLMTEGCQTPDLDGFQNFNTSSVQNKKSNFRYGDRLRIFKIAVTNRGELYDRSVQIGQHLPTVLADYINQVNFIYEKELAIRLQVITPILTFTDKNTDPFTTSNTFNLINESRTAIDQLYAGQDYHLGHLFGYFGGGRAYLNSVCGNSKSGAVTGMDLPLSSPFLRLFAHELGHQFGAGHSFNSDGAFCGQNLFPASAYEIGSGSTLMSYAGSCVRENIESFRSAFFNSGALEEINSFVENRISQGCGTAFFIGNQPPIVNAPSGKTIPARTPFRLEGSGTDPNGNSLIYTWEQHDLGPVGLLGEAAALRPTVPLFRVYDPIAEPIRMFPNLQSILTNDNQATFEILPKVSRELNFYLTGRDNQGGVACDDIKLQVHDTGAPFKIQSFNLPQAIQAGSSVELRWDVAGTNLPPISTSQVDILFSDDGGQSFPVSLKRNTPNDGSELITFPTQITSNARVMVRAEGNYFFDINNADLQILGTPSPPPPSVDDFEMTILATPTNYRQWSNVIFSVALKNTGTANADNVKISIPPLLGKLVFGNSVTSFGNYSSFFGQWDIPRIHPGETAILSLTFFTLVKDETLVVTASLVDRNLTKSVILRPFNTAVLKPDLHLSLIDSPAEGDPGALLSANLLIENSGTAPALGDYMIGVYLSNDNTLDTNDPQIGTIATGNTPLTPLTTTAGFFVPDNLPSGDYFLIYYIDNQEVISESNEGNNRIFAPFKIKGTVPPPPSDCNITSMISQKRCFDNGTPSDPDDDIFSFNLSFAKPDQQPGNFHSEVGNIMRDGVYGGVYIYGPFPISEGNVAGHVEDIFSPNCYSDFMISPTGTCSDDGAQDYCESKSNFPWHEWIAGFSFAGRQNNSGKASYSDFSSAPFSVTAGQTIPVQLTAGFSWFTADEYFRIWLDSNRDGNFTADEILLQKSLPAPPDGTPTFTIFENVVIPFSAKAGMAKMRIQMSRNRFFDACEDLNFGEVEDYLVLISGS